MRGCQHLEEPGNHQIYGISMTETSVASQKKSQFLLVSKANLFIPIKLAAGPFQLYLSNSSKGGFKGAEFNQCLTEEMSHKNNHIDQCCLGMR